MVELLEINFIHRTCEVLIIIDPQYANNGYTKKPLKWLLTMLLVLNMNKVYLYVDIKNEKAVHIYQSNNFEIEGTLKEHFYTRENIEIAM